MRDGFQRLAWHPHRRWLAVGGILELHYARAQQLRPSLDRVAIRGGIVVQFWLKPGEAAVMLGEEERIPAQLR